jgi:hypothetical protein
MKFYLSFWSQGYRGQYEDFNYNLYKLSAYYLKKNYGNVHLITDSIGAKFLEDIGFDSIDTSLDDLPKNIGMIWSLGKIKSYQIISEKGEEFIHVDDDVFLTKEMPDGFLDQGVVAQHKENLVKSFYRIYDFYNYMPVLGNMALGSIDHAANMGIFGGYDLDFIHKYSTESLNLALNLKNINFINNTNFYHSWQPAVMFEQYYMSLLAHQMNKNIYYLFESEGELDFRSKEIGYIHLWSAKKNQKEKFKKDIYKILYYLDLNPRGSVIWKNGEIESIN